MAERELKVRFTGDTKDLERAARQSEGAVKSVGARWGNAAKQIGKFAAAGAVGLGLLGGKIALDGIKVASNTAEAWSKVQTLFGEASKETKKFAESAATNLGMSESAALDAAGAFGALFTAQGFGGQDAADMSEALTILSADLASFNNADPTEVIESMTAAFRGEYDSLQKYIPTINAAAVETKALAMYHKDSADQLTETEKAMATYRLVTEGAGKATGDFARTSDGLANQQKIMAARWEDIQGKIGEKLMPVLLDLSTWFLEEGIPALEAFGKKIVDWVEPQLKKLGEWWDKDGKKAWDDFVKWIDETLLPALEELGTGIVEDVLDVLDKIVQWGKDNPDWALPIAAGIAAITLAIKLFGLAFAGTPLGAAFLAILAIGTALYTAYQTNEDFRTSVDNLFDDLEAKWTTVSESFQTDFLDPMKEKWDSFYNDFLMPLVRGIQTFAGMATEAWRNMAETWGPILAAAGVHIGRIWGSIVAATLFTVRALAALWNGFTLEFGGAPIRIAGVAEILKGIWNGLVTALGVVVRALATLWNGWTINMGDGVIRFQGIAETIKSIWWGLESVVRTVARSLIDIVGSLIGYLSGAWQTVVGLKNNIIGAVQDAKSWWDSLTNPSGWTGMIPGFNMVPVPQPPALASGGIIPGSRWGTLVRAGEGGKAEAIVPLSRMGGTTQNTYNITVDVAPGADPVRAGAAVVDAIRSYERVNGQGWRTVLA